MPRRYSFLEPLAGRLNFLPGAGHSECDVPHTFSFVSLSSSGAGYVDEHLRRITKFYIYLRGKFDYKKTLHGGKVPFGGNYIPSAFLLLLFVAHTEGIRIAGN